MILLIGIVKKNAIMMIDFALEAERKKGSPPRCHLRSVPATLPPHYDDHHGRVVGRAAARAGRRRRSELRRPLGITIVGGLILSQLLTLYTTPVVYLAFDWIARRLHLQIGNPSRTLARE